MPNKLIYEKSPYLLQHAHNPVDWHAWNDETFARATAENKPVFLSIGYATCHWCHVMERESFENQEVAARLNDYFVCIKVDREERPDIDNVYMIACQMLTGSGGWPLNIFMTPDKRPFFAATYMPRNNSFGRIGLVELSQRISELWSSQPDKIYESATSVSEALQRASDFKPSDEPDLALLDRALKQLEDSYDSTAGGFERAPKFPTPHRLSFLLRCHNRTDSASALEMVTHTLDAMRLGGIWDHVGHGFHRYSTDVEWLLPHFEKMLYDQAMISIAYLEAHQLTGIQQYAATAEEIFEYVSRDLRSDSGAFYSAEDADSEGEEGRFYVWSLDELKDILGAAQTEMWATIFNCNPAGNYTDEATGRRTGTNILHLKKPFEEWARILGMPEEDLKAEWQTVRQKLFNYRSRRIRPLLDDKILCDWNGLMIAALATGGRVLQKPAFTEAAEMAAAFILEHMQDQYGRLFHRYREEDLAVPALASDYAYLIYGLLSLYQSTLNLCYAEEALHLQTEMMTKFWDETRGGFFLTAAENAELPIRPKEFYDGATPSANSISLMNLLVLYRLTGDHRWERRSQEMVAAFGGPASTHPTGFAFFLTALDYALCPGQEIVISGSEGKADVQLLIATLQQRFSPNTVVMLKNNGNADRLAKFAGYTDGLQLAQDHATAHICKTSACKDSTTDIQSLIEQLQSSNPKR